MLAKRPPPCSTRLLVDPYRVCVFPWKEHKSQGDLCGHMLHGIGGRRGAIACQYTLACPWLQQMPRSPYMWQQLCNCAAHDLHDCPELSALSPVPVAIASAHGLDKPARPRAEVFSEQWPSHSRSRGWTLSAGAASTKSARVSKPGTAKSGAQTKAAPRRVSLPQYNARARLLPGCTLNGRPPI